MVNSEEIIERTFYISLLYEAINKGLTINPDDYLVNGEPNQALYEKYKIDKGAIGDKFIYIFGIGNNQSRGIKDNPRITVELKAYYPGEIGLNKYELERFDGDMDGFQTVEYDFTSKSTVIDVHLVADTQSQMRVLHEVMYRALPAVGYIKPYFNDINEWKRGGVGPSGNLFIEIGNYYDMPDITHGMLEKVYSYQVKDGFLLEKSTLDVIQPINDISAILNSKIAGVELDVKGI